MNVKKFLILMVVLFLIFLFVRQQTAEKEISETSDVSHVIDTRGNSSRIVPEKPEVKASLKKPAIETNEMPISEDVVIEHIDNQEESVSPMMQSLIESFDKPEHRAPPIVRSAPEEKPSQEELDDPDKYLSFQAKQKEKVLVAYLKAAAPKLEKLNALVEEGKVRGISEERLQEGLRKIKKIEEMVEEIKNQNPDLAEIE